MLWISWREADEGRMGSGMGLLRGGIVALLASGCLLVGVE